MPDDPDVETVIQPSLDTDADDEIAEPPRAARGTSNLPAIVKETPVTPPTFDDRGDTIEHRPELDPFENRQATYIELDPFGADDHAAVTIDYRLDTPPELDTPVDPSIGHARAIGRAIGTGRTQALPARDAADEEPTAPLDDEVDELATYAMIVEQPAAGAEHLPDAMIERAGTDAELATYALIVEPPAADDDAMIGARTRGDRSRADADAMFGDRANADPRIADHSRADDDAMIGDRADANAMVGDRTRADAMLGQQSRAAAMIGDRSRANANPMIGDRADADAMIGDRADANARSGDHSRADADIELALAATLDVRAVSEGELDASADELVTALERGLRRSRSDSAELDRDGEIDALLGDLERELRASGTLSFATCEALRTDRRLRGLESCLAFLRCTVFAGDANIEPIGRRRRVQTCRLLLLSIAAHTQSPRWSAFQVEQMFEVALSIPGAELSDLVQALFALLVDSRGPTSAAQARFIREVGAHVTGKRRRGHSADDFVWIAVRLADPLFPATEAQAFLAAHVLPDKLRVVTRETITRAVRSSVLADEVAHILAQLP